MDTTREHVSLVPLCVTSSISGLKGGSGSPVSSATPRMRSIPCVVAGGAGGAIGETTTPSFSQALITTTGGSLLEVTVDNAQGAVTQKTMVACLQRAYDT